MITEYDCILCLRKLLENYSWVTDLQKFATVYSSEYSTDQNTIKITFLFVSVQLAVRRIRSMSKSSILESFTFSVILFYKNLNL